MNKYSKTHELKIDKEFLERILSGQKRFEIRRDDRDFQVGDWMKLVGGATQVHCKIIYKTTYEQRDGFCVLGFTVGNEDASASRHEDDGVGK